MLLAIDIGNTTLQVGIYSDRELGPTWRLATDHGRLADEYGILVVSLLRAEGIDPGAIDGAIVSSVVPALSGVFRDVVRRFLKVDPIFVSSHMRKPVRIGIDHAEELGADRIADAVGAMTRHAPPPLIVVDFGTATVFDAINEHGVYLGGAISPGDRDLDRRAVRPSVAAGSDRPRAPAKRDRHSHRNGAAIGHPVRLRRPGGRHHRSLQGRTGARQSHCHGWLGEADRA